MNRLLELQSFGGGGGDDEEAGKFSPTNAGSVVPPPTAAAAGDGDEKKTQLSDDDDDNAHQKPSAASAAIAAAAGGGGSRADNYVVQIDEELDKTMMLIDDIRLGNRDIAALTIRIKEQTAENFKSFEAENDQKGTLEIEKLMDQVSAKSKTVKEKLDELSAATKKLMEDEEVMKDNAATVKIQQNQHQHLTRAFIDCINSYNAAVSENDKKLREQAVRRIKLKYTKGDGTTCSEEEAREMAQQVLETGQTDVLFQASREVLDGVMETRRDIMRIERSMRELKQIMDDLSALILEQGEVMDVILNNVEKSVEYVKSGREKLKKAKEYEEDTSSKMKYLFACVCVLFLIILASTLGATIPT